MKKWFNTNYHYIVPKFEKDTEVKLAGHKIFDEYQEAKELGLDTRPILVGPFTLLQLSDFEEGVEAAQFVDALAVAYQEVFVKLADLGADHIQLDEPALVKGLSAEEKVLFLDLYRKILADKKGLEVLIQTYFGDVRDIYSDLIELPVDAIGLDFVEGKKTLELVKSGFSADKTLYAGIVNGKNIWCNNYEKSLAVLEQVSAEKLVLTSSCALLHIPFTTSNEDFEEAILKHFAFAAEKLNELWDLDAIRNDGGAEALAANKALFAAERVGQNAELAARIAGLTDADYTRLPILQSVRKFSTRRSICHHCRLRQLVPSLKPRKFGPSVWPSARENCPRKIMTSSWLSRSTNGSSGRKKLVLMFWFTGNSSAMT